MQIKVNVNGKVLDITAKEGSLLIDALRAGNVDISADCADRGICGSCRVRFLTGAPDATECDFSIFTEEELNNGWRLSCKARLAGPAEIELPDIGLNRVLLDDAAGMPGGGTIGKPGFAADIGTTTVVVYLIDMQSGGAVDSAGAMNAQRRYGADVASRIHHAMLHGIEPLQSAISRQLGDMIAGLLVKHRLDPDGKYDILAVGNTAMAHFLLGYDVSGLGAAPFMPHSLARAKLDSRKAGIAAGGELTVMEGVSGYVGSDILSGAVLCGIAESKGYRLLVDIGTNGEIMLGNSQQLLCCSTAAGPAFEGVSINAGTGGVPGAISRLVITRKGGAFGIRYKTIGDKPPVGICGSGVIDAAAQMLQTGIIDRTGRFAEASGAMSGVIRHSEQRGYYIELAKDGGKSILFTQSDVREVQLAKSAIASGIRILLDEAGIGFDSIEQVCLAGGFGNYMDVESAFAIGLLPKELSGRIEPKGNTAGRGAIAALRSAAFRDKMAAYAQKARYVELSGHKGFQDYFIENMRF